MNFEQEAERIAQACRRKQWPPRAVVIAGAESVRTFPADSTLSESILRNPGFVGVYDGRVLEHHLEEDLEWVYARRFPAQ